LENRTIEVVLLQQDKHLGEKYEVVRVKPIFARNVLFPKNIAVPADNANLNKYKQKMEAAKKEIENKASGYEDMLMKIQSNDGVVFARKANKEGVLYAQVSDEDIAKAIKETYKVTILPHYLRIKKKIKQVGEYFVPFMYQSIKKDIKVIVHAEDEKEEAKKEVVEPTEEKVAE
jgi:large subunit ribosomal protein L9